MQAARWARRVLWNVPVGLQLSAIYAVLLVVVLSLLGLALYTQLDSFLVKNTAERLDLTTRRNLERPGPSDRPGDQGQNPGPPGPRGGPNDNPEQYAAFLVRELSGSDVAVAVLDVNGQIITSSQTLVAGETPYFPTLPAGWQEKLAGGATAQWVLLGANEERQLVVVRPTSFPTRDGGQQSQFYIEQVASLGAADDILNQLRLYLALGIIMGTVIGVAVGLALTRAVLRPLDKMVVTAEAISAGDLQRRLRLPPGRNETARLGSAFDHMVDRLAGVLEAQRRFVADASHELRTPLTSLEGLSEIVMMGADRGDSRVVQKMLRSMHGELGRMNRLVNDLLTLSRLDGKTVTSPEPVDAGRVLSDVATQMAPMAEAKGVSMSLQIDEDKGPLIVDAEPDRLKQVVLNLVDNAIRYSPSHGEVRIKGTKDVSASEVRMRVEDDGPGIAPEDLPYIFDRFYRGDVSRARATGNSGLGLSIARAIVTTYNGTISAQSTPGEGATFTVTLPASQAHYVAGHAEEVLEPEDSLVGRAG